MKKEYQYILFDWDGCLAKTLQVHLQAYKDTFAEYDVHPSDHDITHKVFGDWNGPAKVGVEDVKGFTEKYLVRVRKHFIEAELYPHVEATLLSFLDNGKKLALVTTSTINLVRPALQKNKLEKYFQVVLAAEDVTKHKPEPEIVEEALQKLGGNKQQTIIIGDSKSDLGAAQNAGIDSVLFYPSDHELYYPKEHLMKFNPTFVIEDHAELEKILI